MRTVTIWAVVALMLGVATAHAQVPIEYGSTTSGQISPAGEVDIYTFSGTAGDLLVIRMTEASSYPSAYMEPRIELRTGAGTVLESGSDGSQAEITATLPASDDYTIFASDDGGEDGGHYALFIQRTFDPGAATPIAYGETEPGSLSPNGDVDTYVFDGSAGDTVIVRLTEASSYPSAYMEPFIEVYGPSGSLLDTDSDGSQAEVQIVLTDNGPHSIWASDGYPGDDGGTYAIFLQRTHEPGAPTTIEYGQTLAGSLSPNGDVDTYSFTGQPGEKIVVRLTEASSYPSAYMEPLIEVYGPSGSLLASNSGGAHAQVWLTLDESGTYSAWASDGHPGDDGGTYAIYIQRVPDPVSARTILYGQTKTGSLSPNGDFDTFAFVGAAGDSVFAQLTEESSYPSAYMEPRVELYSTDGELLASGWDDSQVQVGARLPSDGQYTILVGDKPPCDDGGSYSLFLFGFPVTQLLVFPHSLDYGCVEQGVCCSDSTIIYNRGSTSLTVSSLVIAGPGATAYSTVDTAPLQVEAHSTQTVHVDFIPDVTDTCCATLEMATTVGDAIVELFGVGMATPVEGSFYAQATDAGDVILRWSASSLDGGEGLNVCRATCSDGPFTKVNAAPLPPNTTGEYVDQTVWPETTFWYQLRALLCDGTEEVVGSALASATTGGDLVLRLYPPRPNPSAGEVSFSVEIPPHTGRVDLLLYNVAGKIIRSLDSPEPTPGRHEIKWDGRDNHGRALPSGVYFARLEVGRQAKTKKLILLR